jgi:hypothetical protein
MKEGVILVRSIQIQAGIVISCVAGVLMVYMRFVRRVVFIGTFFICKSWIFSFEEQGDFNISGKLWNFVCF